MPKDSLSLIPASILLKYYCCGFHMILSRLNFLFYWVKLVYDNSVKQHLMTKGTPSLQTLKCDHHPRKLWLHPVSDSRKSLTYWGESSMICTEWLCGKLWHVNKTHGHPLNVKMKFSITRKWSHLVHHLLYVSISPNFSNGRWN